MLFWLWDGSQTFQFDPTKVDAFLDHTFFGFDTEGNRNVTTTRYDIRDCNASDFNNTQFERDTWKNF